MLFSLVGVVIFLTFAIFPVIAASPEGYLEKADGVMIAGWAKDADYNGPIPVHIYVDGTIVDGELANLDRNDVGPHIFSWRHEPFGAGDHKVQVFAIGVDVNGEPNGENVALGCISGNCVDQNTAHFDVGCSGLLRNELEWCNGVPNYWINRQKDTKLLMNNNIKVGINTSYGGAIMQLYGWDKGFNLIEEHGGGSLQFSIWGQDANTTTAKHYRYPKNGITCDATAYDSVEQCTDNGKYECAYRINGSQVSTCEKIPCNSWDVGAPWNPIMAQGWYCSWDDPSNDVFYSATCGDNCWETKLDSPGHFTKNSEGQRGMIFGQKAILGDIYAKLVYTLDYTGTNNYAAHPQEIPAIFTEKVWQKYYFYGGNNPYQDINSQVTELGPSTGPNDRLIKLVGKTSFYPHDPAYAATEDWWGICDDATPKQHCLTVAAFDPQVIEAGLTVGTVNWTGYVTALGFFPTPSGTHKEITVYVFPYKYNDVVAGKTIRQRIYELKNSAQFTVSQLKNLLINYASSIDNQYRPVDGKINALDAGYIIKYIAQ